PEQKNLKPSQVKQITSRLADAGVTVVILDWRHNNIQNGTSIVCPPKSIVPQDSDHLAALIEQSNGFIGIDSGPGHLAGALNVPAYLLWTGEKWPSCCIEPAPNMHHLVTPESLSVCPSD